ncbi:MAG: ATP-dependent RNA helicase HrpA [Panacagrimonas sp.]
MTALADLRARLNLARDQLMARDVARLTRQLAHAQSKRFDEARFLRELAAGLARKSARESFRPDTLRYPEELPVSQARETLLDAIRTYQVIVVCGETGSGKTTQLPKLCLELGRGSRGLIGHTQPRRLAARSVAARIARELDGTVGELVGFETRFDRRVSDRSLVKLMTDGILLAELQRDQLLTAYDTIIIDEAHERSLNIDFLLGWLKQLLPRRPDLKVIVTSATLDPDKLSRHFGGAPIIQIEGRTYPVEMRYRPNEDEDESEDAVAAAIESLWTGGRVGDTLVFLPGEREIHELSRMLQGRFPKAQILPLYSRLPATQQDRVFTAGGPPRIVLATNVAETSVTVPGIRYVVDLGTARLSRWSTRLGIQQLHIEPVSQAAANQRAGRCGRVAPGICVRLYAEDDFATRDAFTIPEVQRSNLAGVILQMAALGLGDVDHFPWVDEPDSRQISEGYRLLQTLGALDEERVLTKLGRELARLPLDPRVARIALAGRSSACAHEVWVLAAALSVQDPHEVPPEAQEQARQKHAEWRHPRSDFLTLLGLWRRWQEWSAASSNRQLRKLCREHFVSFLRMEEWESVYRQVVDMIGVAQPANDRWLDTTDLDKLYVPIHQCLIAGLVDHIGLKIPEKPEYQGPRGRRFRIFPGSKLASRSPPWLMCAAIVQTSQVFARTVAAIEPEWLEQVAPHLIKRSVQQPEWNAERGEVGCLEHLTLFGLPLGQQIRHYGSIDPADARRIFILDALVRGDLPNKPAFLRHNLERAESVREKETRLRRPDLLADEDQLFAFYDQRLPADLCTAAGLKKWLHAGQHAADRSKLRMSETEILRPGANADIESLFPDRLAMAGHRLRLSYAHEPGEDEDGVSFHIPLALLFALPAERFDWLVPGLLPARIEGLIRTLPQNLRRFCTPAAEYASALANSLSPDEGALLPAICARFKTMTGVELRPADFSPAKLAAHLSPRLVLEDANGKRIAEAAGLDELQQSSREPARAALASTALADETSKRWVRDRILDWDFGDLPDHIVLPTGARAYPAIRAVGEHLGLGLFESVEAAEDAHLKGVRKLLLARLNDRLRDLARTAKARLGLAQIGLKLAPETLAHQIAERAAARAWPLAGLRTQIAFQDALQHRAEFGRLAAAMLDDACGWLVTAAALRKRLRDLGSQWPDARADISAQLDTLLIEGFVLSLPDEQWPRVAVFLKACATRLDRLPNKPARDLELTRRVQPFVKRLPAPFHPARWVIEEWRVTLFAQELRALGGPNEARVTEALGTASSVP